MPLGVALGLLGSGAQAWHSPPVPTLEHQGLVEMFRDNPSLAPHLLALVFHTAVPPHASARVADSALDQLVPVELRADLVVELHNEQGAAVFAIVVEVQREKTPRKKYAWPAHLAIAHAERGCPAVLLVIADDAGVASWAAETIDVGARRTTVRPFVLGPTALLVMERKGFRLVPTCEEAEEEVKPPAA